MPSKKCPSGKVLNPKTKRCVNTTGKIGRQILARQESGVSKRRSKKEHCSQEMIDRWNWASQIVSKRGRSRRYKTYPGDSRRYLFYVMLFS